MQALVRIEYEGELDMYMDARYFIDSAINYKSKWSTRRDKRLGICYAVINLSPDFERFDTFETIKRNAEAMNIKIVTPNIVKWVCKMDHGAYRVIPRRFVATRPVSPAMRIPGDLPDKYLPGFER